MHQKLEKHFSEHMPDFGIHGHKFYMAVSTPERSHCAQGIDVYRTITTNNTINMNMLSGRSRKTLAQDCLSMRKFPLLTKTRSLFAHAHIAIVAERFLGWVAGHGCLKVVDSFF